MNRIRNDRDANHILAWGGCMRPAPAYRIHAQNYTPAPQKQPNAFQRLMRRICGVK